MITWVLSLRPEAWEAILAWAAVVVGWFTVPFGISWCSTKLQQHWDRRERPGPRTIALNGVDAPAEVTDEPK